MVVEAVVDDVQDSLIETASAVADSFKHTKIAETAVSLPFCLVFCSGGTLTNSSVAVL